MKLFLLPLVSLAFAAPTAPAEAPPAPAADMPVVDPSVSDARCPETPMSLARKQGRNPQARKLGELPPAQAFMAVDRRVDGCPMPMLASETRR